MTIFGQFFDDPIIAEHTLRVMTYILQNRFYLYYVQGSKKDVGRRLLTQTLWNQIRRICHFLWNSKNPTQMKSFFDWLHVMLESFQRRGGKNRKQTFYFFVHLNGTNWAPLPRGFLPYFSKAVTMKSVDLPAMDSFLRVFLLFDKLCFALHWRLIA